MKICFLLNHLGMGGAERQMITLAVGLSRHHSVTVIACKKGPFSNLLQSNNIKVIYIKKILLLQFLPILFFHLHKENIDCLITFHPVLFVASIFIKLLNKMKVVWEVRGDITHVKSAMTYKIARKLAPFADIIVANTRKSVDFLAKNSKVNVHYIANGLDKQQFYIDPLMRDRVRAKWKIAPDEVVIGRVGRLCHKTKNYPLFLQAAAQIASQYKNIKWVIIGNGPASYVRELKQLAKQLNIEQHVIFIEGHLDLCPIYNALDILCSTSDTEGTPNVVIEAMACGVVCVVTDVGASKKVVADLGKIVPPKDLTALTAALSSTIENLPDYASAAYKEKLRTHVLTDYSHEKCLQDHLDLLESVSR